MTVLSFARKLTACMALTLALGWAASAGYAVSAKSLEKQARKIQGKLLKYPKGAFLHFEFRDGSEGTGKLGTLSDHSFSFTNTDSNLDESHNYSDVTKIEKGKTYIGKNSEPAHHRLHMPF
jgi:hypothetical protein